MDNQQRQREHEEQLRQLAARLHSAREQERAQVARELHDELGQTLTALKLDISRTLAAVSPELLTPSVIDRMQSLVGLSDIAIATVKRIATRLRPPALDHLGLAEAIHWEAQAIKVRSGLRCQVRANNSVTALTPEQQIAVFRIFQESMTNIVRHAQASAVHIDLTEREHQFEMRIRDNGCGITDAQAANPAAIGLVGMRERASLVGGQFKIVGHRGKGTLVCIQIPVTPKASGRVMAFERRRKVARSR